MTSTEHSAPRFGVNYVPSSGWWYSWTDWDQASIDADLTAIAGLGMDHIRIHCLWPLFQPNPTLVSVYLLARLDDLMASAERAGLGVVITVFNGWLSGFEFRPAWVVGEANILTDPAILEAQERLIESIAATVGDRGNLIGLDLSNEPSSLHYAELSTTSRLDADAWVRRLLEHCERVLPGRTHTVGMDHVPWLTGESAFGRHELGRAGDVTSIHSWIFFTGALERYGQDGSGTIHLAEYMLELAKAYSADPARPVWLQEYGLAPEWLDADRRLDFVERATLAAAGVEGVWGITWWCSHDVDRGLSGFAELEYDLGLLTVDNAVKPIGERLRDVIAAVRAADAAPARPVALVLPDDRTPDLDFGDTFFAMIDRGVRPTVVLESRAGDEDYLEARGIRTLVRAEAVRA